MKGLILDTSTSWALIGEIEDDALTLSHLLEGGKNLTKTLFPFLEERAPFQNFDYIAVGHGPGSYMGLRTAATIAKTLAYALDLPLISFPSPLAYIPEGVSGAFAFIGDAKGGQYYLIEGMATENGIHDLSEPRLISGSEITEATEGKDVTIGPGFIPPKPNMKNLIPYLKEREPTAALKLEYLRYGPLLK